MVSTVSCELRFGSWTARSSASCVWGLTPPHGRCSLWLDKGISGLTDWNLQDRAAIPMISLFPWVLCYMLLTQCRNIDLGNNKSHAIYVRKVWPCYLSFPLTWHPVPPASTHPSVCISRRQLQRKVVEGERTGWHSLCNAPKRILSGLENTGVHCVRAREEAETQVCLASRSSSGLNSATSCHPASIMASARTAVTVETRVCRLLSFPHRRRLRKCHWALTCGPSHSRWHLPASCL